MKQTTNYNLIKPELTDSPPDITAMNPNWDKIDGKIKELEEENENIAIQKANLINNKVPINELPIANQIEAEAGVSDSTLMTPLKVRQFMASNGGSGGGVTNVVFQSGKRYWKYTASQATNAIVIPTEQFNPINDVLEIVDDNNLILLKDINYVISNNTVTLIEYSLIAGESLHFMITQTAYDYNSLANKPEIVNDYSGGINKIASAESVKQLFQLASDGKTNVAAEINSKGVAATAAETFSSLANKIKTFLTKIEGNATAGDVLSGKTFKNSSGSLITGTIPSKTAQTYTPGTTNQTIAAGQYLSGVQTIEGSANLTPANIKNGVNIFGKVGTLKGLNDLSGSLVGVKSEGFGNSYNTHVPCIATSADLVTFYLDKNNPTTSTTVNATMFGITDRFSGTVPEGNFEVYTESGTFSGIDDKGTKFNNVSNITVSGTYGTVGAITIFNFNNCVCRFRVSNFLYSTGVTYAVATYIQ